MTTHERVRGFARFLTASWEAVKSLCPDGLELDEFLENWEQANWELLVEVDLGANRFLVPLNAADIYDGSSRATYPDAVPTDMILCTASGAVIDQETHKPVNLGEGLPIEQFVSFDGLLYHREPPFDHVRVRNVDEYFVLRCADVRFESFPYREI
jgi:hypothetical protein